MHLLKVPVSNSETACSFLCRRPSKNYQNHNSAAGATENYLTGVGLTQRKTGFDGSPGLPIGGSTPTSKSGPSIEIEIASNFYVVRFFNLACFKQFAHFVSMTGSYKLGDIEVVYSFIIPTQR